MHFLKVGSISSSLQFHGWTRSKSDNVDVQSMNYFQLHATLIRRVFFSIFQGISGSYRLLPQSTGRQHNVPITHPPTASPTMCESQSSVEEVIQLDDLDPELKKPTNKTVLVEQQKHADENLFLRYLELDPTEGPDAIPAATQRKASGNKCGRTPFTQTKRLIRQPKAGFGFSVVWTHPPRVERVEKGLPADKAGILPGDYIIFVDKHNVVMTPEIDILNLIR